MHNCTQHCLPYISKRKRELIRALSCPQIRAGTRHFPPLHTRAGPSKKRKPDSSLTLDNATWGIDGTTGKLADMQELGLWEPFVVKVQTLKTAMEAACMILRIDDIVSGMSQGPKG